MKCCLRHWQNTFTMGDSCALSVNSSRQDTLRNGRTIPPLAVRPRAGLLALHFPTSTSVNWIPMSKTCSFQCTPKEPDGRRTVNMTTSSVKPTDYEKEVSTPRQQRRGKPRKSFHQLTSTMQTTGD